jgi:hypothetical protein
MILHKSRETAVILDRVELLHFPTQLRLIRLFPIFVYRSIPLKFLGRRNGAISLYLLKLA